jgi:hypothetical protein
MNKVRFLAWLCGGLLLANLALAAALLLKKPVRPHHEGPRDLIIEKLHFDGEQVEEYDKLIHWHRAEISKTENSILEVKNLLYAGLAQNDSTQKDSLVSVLCNLQVQIENIHYLHFRDIRKLCRAEQLKYFESLTLEIATLFSRGPKHPKP